jgi:TonB family protein
MSLFLSAEEPVFNTQETVFSTQETIFRYREYIEEFHDAFKSNDIFFGSPDDFFAFCKILKTDLPLRTELAKLTRSLLMKENHNISVRTLLTVIAIASGGPDIATTHRDVSPQINILIGFLTNAVRCRQINPDNLDTMCLSSPFLETTQHVAPPDATQPSPAISTDLDDDLPAVPPLDSSDNPPENSDDFKQSLTRLELTALQVKMHLDSIEERISRIEPHLENVPPPATTAQPLHEPEDPPAQDLYLKRIMPASYVEPEREPEDLILRADDTRGIPLLSYDEPTPFFFSGAKVIVVFLLLGVAIAAGIFLYLHRGDDYLARSYQYLQQRLSALRQSPPAASITANTSTATPQPTTTTPTPKTPPDHTTTELALHLQPTVEITSSAMTGNIISAPKPIYPKLAQQRNTEGRVILQATVSNDGKIQNLRGIKGPPLLQDAAVDAVSTWRYKPHLVDGRPMPVAIIITIDFTLEPSPDNQQSSVTPSP